MTDRTSMRGGARVATLGIFTILVAASATAQPRWGRPSTPRSGACFYRDANFEGDYFCAGAGEDIPVMPNGMNDQVSSVRIYGDVEVRLYQDGQFRGRSQSVTRSIRNLKDEGWNDRLSSAQVRGGRDGGGNYGGGARQDYDRIVRRAYQDILKRDPDSEGLRIYRSHMIDDNWSEAQVREALRNSREFRELNSMTKEKAEEIVRRAYRSVLNRDPDPASRTYVDKVLHDRWTEQDVANELRKSPEFRSKKQ
jgi:hypothetical protein